MAAPTNQTANLYAQAFGTCSSGRFPTSPVRANKDPANTDIQGPFGQYPVGQEWINTSTGSVFALVSFSSANNQVLANWVALGGGSTTLSSLNGDTGSASPVAGAITIAGGTNITTVASGSTVTANLDPNVTISGTLSAGQLEATADTGGVAASIAITNTSDATISTGVGSVLMSSANPADNAIWIKVYVGTTAYWVPGWATNAP